METLVKLMLELLQNKMKLKRIMSIAFYDKISVIAIMKFSNFKSLHGSIHNMYRNRQGFSEVNFAGRFC